MGVVMEALDYWKLCEEVSLFQAIMLCLDQDPQDDSSHELEGKSSQNQPVGYGAIKTALVAALKAKTIDGTHYEKVLYDRDGDECGNIEGSTDLDKSRVRLDSVRVFLRSKGVVSGSFVSQTKPVESDYLDRANPAYAPKLAAAVAAWLAVARNESALHGKTPKQALQKWLREHASEYGLTKDDGNPNEDGIDQVCKVANWKPEGGAAKTPTHAPETRPPVNKLKIIKK